MGTIVDITDTKTNEHYKLTDQDKKDILDTMQKEVDRNESLKILAELPSNNGIEENTENRQGEDKLVNVSIDPKTGEKTILGPAIEDINNIKNTEEEFFSSLENTNLDTHYDIHIEDVKKVSQEETSFGKFDISDESTLELLKVINKYKSEGKIGYKDLPAEVKGIIDKYMLENGMAPGVKVYNEARNEISNMLIDEYINQIEINKWSDDFNIQMEKFSDEMKTEMSPLYQEMNQDREQYLENLIGNLTDESKKEKAEAVLDSIKDAFSLNRLKEAAPRIKVKKFDIEKPQREYTSLLGKYVNTQYHIYDLFMVTNVLHRHLQKLKLIEPEDNTTSIKFIIAFCKFCKNYKTTVTEEHAFMYFVTYNIILLDIYIGETYDKYSSEFLANVLEVVNKLK